MHNIQDELRMPIYPDAISWLLKLSIAVKLHLNAVPVDSLRLSRDHLLKWSEIRQPLKQEVNPRMVGAIGFIDDLVLDLFYVVDNARPIGVVDWHRVEILWKHIKYIQSLEETVERK